MKIEITNEARKYLLMDLETIYLIKEPFPPTKKLIKKLKEKNENNRN
jgi:hypothetical protein